MNIFYPLFRTEKRVPMVKTPSSNSNDNNDESVKKFGKAKAISSDQYFGRTAEMDVSGMNVRNEKRE